MLNRLIDACLDNRWLVLPLLLLLTGAGVWIAMQIPIDAFPDLTGKQVVVITEAPGLSPGEVERLVTFPVESTLMGLPGTQGVRSVSKLGLSMVTVLFDDPVNIWFARQVINERLQEARSRMPEGLDPRMGPVATAFGEVYQYTIESRGMSLMDRKTLHDWQIKLQLRAVPGVNEVNTWGGETKVFTVQVDPAALRRYGLSLRDVFERLRENNENFGGGFIEHAGEQYTVRGLGRAVDSRDIAGIVLREHEGTPVLVRDVAEIVDGALPRQGATLRDGKGETVSGMAIMLMGENGREVIRRVKQRLESLSLPPGVRIVPFYDQSEVIEGTIRTVRRNLLEAVALVAAVLLVFLGNFRAALLVVCAIPFSMLFGFAGMALFGVTANLMSLGAIDFGMIVDGSVVMVENSVRRLSERGEEQTVLETVRFAAHEVARPIVFGVAIIIAVYLPIFFLEGLEGRMFRPMAVTVCSALFGSLLLALFVVPAMTTLVLRKRVQHNQGGWFERFRLAYRRSLEWVTTHRMIAVPAAAVPVVAAVWSLAFIGTEFMPRLDEGSILITTKKLPGISLPESVALSNQVEKVLLTIPEVRGVVTKLGRPDLATEAMGVYEGDVYVLLHPQEQWRVETKEALVGVMEEKLKDVPGMAFNFTQPMAMRLDETISGIKADVAVKIFGEDPDVLTRLAERARRLLAAVPGAADVQAEVISGVGELRIDVDRAAIARYGLDIRDVQELVDSTTGGYRISELIEGQRRFPIAVRLPERYRNDLGAMGDLLLQGPGGERVRLDEVTRIERVRGPELISRENAQRRIVVQANVRGRDLGGFVAEAQQRMGKALPLPPGYLIDWGGQFENQERAMKRLSLVVPLSIGIIFSLLFATFRSAPQALLILLNVPFALVGGVASLWLRDLNLNLSASVGFIALFGVAVLNGIVMVTYINQLRQGGEEMHEAVIEGASRRLRPVLMTALVASLGFLPMALSQRMGSEVQRPLATVVIGGLISSTLLTLYILPAMYPWFSRRLNGRRPA